ncbi:hypothetical protein K449DRAFT_431392 [Hypoxylon sp. EC38]|nr:hypothetical protein K449DRAFT_431392 [Hypoxylon sp. EC38]
MAAITTSLSRMHRTLSFLLFICVFAQFIQAQNPNPTTVPIFLPGYNATQWSFLRGSVVSSNDVETTYTIFCASVTQGCHIGGGTLLPFTFAEGPSTMHLERTVESTISATSACQLYGTAAAICHGTISLGAVAIGPTTGPTVESTAPFTLTGSDVARLWGVLTLDEPPLTSVNPSRSQTYTCYPSQATGLLDPGFSSVGGTESQSGSATPTATSDAGSVTSPVTEGQSSATKLSVRGEREGWIGSRSSMLAASLLLAVLIPVWLW